MRTIDMKNWPRRQHYELYSAFDQPHFSLCANVDLSRFYPFIKEQQHSFTIAIVYLIARTANDIPEFRYRIRGGTVIEHELVHPSTTVLTADELFSFCTFTYQPDFKQFAAHAAERIAYVKQHPILSDGPEQDDLLFMTSIPWVSFTSLMHPIHLHPADSVPRLAWGKYFWEGQAIKMPLSIQGHHALMDGLHLGKFYQRFQAYLDQPQVLQTQPQPAEINRY